MYITVVGEKTISTTHTYSVVWLLVWFHLLLGCFSRLLKRIALYLFLGAWPLVGLSLGGHQGQQRRRVFVSTSRAKGPLERTPMADVYTPPLLLVDFSCLAVLACARTAMCEACVFPLTLYRHFLCCLLLPVFALLLGSLPCAGPGNGLRFVFFH